MALNLKIDVQDDEAKAKIKKLESEWEKATASVEKQKEKVNELNKELKRVTEFLEAARDKKIDLNVEPLEKQVKNLNQELKQSNTELKRLEANAQLAGINLKKAILLPQTQGISKNILPQTFTSGTSGINLFRNALNGIYSSFSGLSNIVSSFISKIFSLSKTIFIFNLISGGLREIRNAVSDYINTNSQLQSSLAQVRGNLITAFQPIWELILPYLIKFTQWLAQATAYISGFISAIFGKSEQYSRNNAKSLQQQIALSKDSSKALQKQKKSTDDLTKANKKNNMSLAKFDELTMLINKKNSKNKSSPTSPNLGAGGITTSGINPRVSFDTSGIDLSGIIKIVEQIKAFLRPLKEPFENLLNALDRLSKYTFEAFIDFFNLFLKPLAEYIVSTALPEFLNMLADSLNRMNFEKVNESLREFWEALEPFTEEVIDSVLWFVEKFLLPIAEWTVTDAIPEFLRVTTKLINILNKSLKILRPILEYLYTKLIKPIGDYLNGIFHDIMNDINNLLDETYSFLEQNNDGITKLSYTIINILSFAFNVIGKTISFTIQQMREFFKSLYQYALDTTKNVIQIFNGLTDFISGIFTGNFRLAFRGLYNVVAGLINNIIDAINFMLRNLVSGFANIINPIIDTFNGFTGSNFRRITVSERIIGKLPYLAQGAVIPPNSPFLAMLGDQRSGVNIETPLETMKQAFKEALNENSINSNGSYTFVAQLDGRTIFEETVRQNDMYINQSGRSAFVTN